MRPRSLAAAAFLLLSLAAWPSVVGAADGLTMEARTMLAGHARVGSWAAISVHLKNDGPPIQGELRVTGGTQGQTRFGTAVDLPTGSDKTYVIYAQPPAFGRDLPVTLVSGDQQIASAKASFTIHDASQTSIGVIAERPGEIVSGIDLIPVQNQVGAAIVQLTPEDLPDRVEAWSGLDRLIWQDIDSNRLTTAQLAALKGWIAGGGRLVIVGGTAGPGSLSAFSDALLPYRPTATIDVAPASVAPILGALPAGTADLPALGGTLIAGQVLATSGDQVIAAERPYGTGAVTLIGVDPTTKAIAGSPAVKDLWRSVLPTRNPTGAAISDDSQFVSAVSQLPSLALPPIGGLIALLGAYILLVGPVNYLVLKRLDRREWAWITMPVLIGIFAVGAYAYGALLRGSDVIVNEIAVVRGSPGTTDGAAQVYLGVFSPSRGTYQLRIPGGPLLSAPISDFFGSDGSGTTSALDILQGEPAQVRDLAVSFGSLRAIRAQTAVSVPKIESDLRLEGGRLKGTITNASDVTIERPAVVLGSSVDVLDDLAPGAVGQVDVAIAPVQTGQSLSDQIVGNAFFSDTQTGTNATQMDAYIRHTMIDQLTFDPNWGTTNSLAADGAVILGWKSGSLLPVEIAGQKPQTAGNVLYYLPADVAVHGATTFRGDLMRSTVVDTDAAFFSKDPFSINFGRGSATVAYRPIAFDGRITPTKLTLGMNFGGDQISVPDPDPIKPLPAIPPTCTDPSAPGCSQLGWDGMPEVEIFDLTSSEWVRLPHLSGGSSYAVDEPTRYVEPTSGKVLLRFVNDRGDGVGFTFDVGLTGDIQ